MLPSESSDRATSFGVSQGTVRKGARRVEPLKERGGAAPGQRDVRRRAHPPERALFHFFHIAAEDGTADTAVRCQPTVRCYSCQPSPRHRGQNSNRRTAIRSSHARDSRNSSRVREMAGEPAISETVIVPAALFADIDKRTLNDVPNELYQLYEQKYGITVHRAVERVRAVGASDIDAKLLGKKPGTPLLEIERIAETVDGRPVELRVSRCLTEGRHYVSTIV